MILWIALREHQCIGFGGMEVRQGDGALGSCGIGIPNGIASQHIAGIVQADGQRDGYIMVVVVDGIDTRQGLVVALRARWLHLGDEEWRADLAQDAVAGLGREVCLCDSMSADAVFPIPLFTHLGTVILQAEVDEAAYKWLSFPVVDMEEHFVHAAGIATGESRLTESTFGDEQRAAIQGLFDA